MMKSVDALMHQALAENVFPGGVLLVSQADEIVFFKSYGLANIFAKKAMTKDTIFDLASLTKPLATTLAVMVLIQDSRLSLEQEIGSIISSFKNTEKEEIKIKHLLAHVSGLPDYRPYYIQLSQLPQEARKPALKDFLVDEPLLHPIGAKVLYSDLGFMILSWVVEHISGERLDHLVQKRLYDPLGIKKLFFVELPSGSRRGLFAATEQCPWRQMLLNGLVHDENAFVVGGIEGHAGLFGTAAEVNRLLAVLLSIFHGNLPGSVIRKDVIHSFFVPPDFAGRALGFDSPDQRDASCGQYFSETSVGHLGFTGTSFWMDLERSIVVVLLTNRIHPSRDNDKIKAFRPKLHDAVMKGIIGSN